MEGKLKEKGITLIALVVTIIVLLILAGISLDMLTGTNGLLSKSKKAGENSIVGEEKERITMAYNGALTEKYKTDINATVNAEDMRAEFYRNGTNATVSGNGRIEILFNETNHLYYIDEHGKIIEPNLGEINEQENIYEYTNDGWIIGLKDGYIYETFGGRKNVTIGEIAALNISHLEVAEFLHYRLVDELNGTLKIPNKIEDVQIIGIDRYAFMGIDNLETVEMANGIKVVGDSAFEKCHELKNIKLPDNLEIIFNSAFNCCDKLVSISIPRGVNYIGKSAFNGCNHLTNIEIPNTVKNIGPYAFRETLWYENLLDGDIYINNIYYKYKGIMPENTTISIREGTTQIAGMAFAGCSELTSIEIPNSVTSIEVYAFYGCSGLTSVEIPSSVTSIELGAFYGCSGLTKIYIPETVTEVGSLPFENCSSNLKIYCEAANSNQNWDNEWNYYSYTESLDVEYNYSLEDFRNLSE